MTLALYIYLIDVVNSLSVFTFIITVLSGIGAVGLLLYTTMLFEYYSEKKDLETKQKLKPFVTTLKVLIVICPLFGLLAVLIPSKKTMYAIAAAYYGEQAVKSETFQRLNGKAMQLLEMKIDDLLEEKK